MNKRNCGHGHQVLDGGTYICQHCGETSVGRSLEAVLVVPEPKR